MTTIKKAQKGAMVSKPIPSVKSKELKPKTINVPKEVKYPHSGYSSTSKPSGLYKSGGKVAPCMNCGGKTKKKK